MRRNRRPNPIESKGDLTPQAVIMDAVLSSVDMSYYNSRYRQAHYAFGEAWDKTADYDVARSDDDLPDFPEIRMNQSEVGRSRRISNAEFWALQAIMQSAPMVRSPQVDKLTAEVRAQFFRDRYIGGGYRDGEWAMELESAFLDGHGLGNGWVEIGLIDDPMTQRQKVHLRNSPLCRTFWDRTERNPGRASFWATTYYMDRLDAEAEYGKDAVTKAGIRNVRSEGGSRQIEQVRITRYYDIGIGKYRPTMATIIGSITGGVYKIEANPFGCIPAAYYSHVHLPGMDRAIGQIVMKMPTQEMINQIERQLREALKLKTFRIIDVTMFDEDDIVAVAQGKQSHVRLKRDISDKREPIFNVPGAEVGQTLLAMLQLMERQYNADSGQNDIDRGNLTDEKRTLGEVELMDQRSSTQQSWALFQATKMMERVASKVFKVAAMYDRAPLTLDIFGSNLVVNDPTNPVTWMDQWLMEHSNIVIDAQSLRQSDTAREKAARLQELATLREFGVNPMWLQKEALKALGESDLNEAMAQPQMPGMPGMGQQNLAGTPAN